MAETLTLFKYDADIHFMLADDINKTVNPPMNNKIIKIYTIIFHIYQVF